MRGSPLLRALLVFLLIASLAPALWRMTEPAPAARQPAPPQPEVVPVKPARMALTFTSPAQRVSVLHLGREVWAKESPAADEEADLALPWPAEGIELHFKVQWPAEARAAMRVRITDPAGAEHDAAVWRADEVLAFP
jgi:hypothetical protein